MPGSSKFRAAGLVLVMVPLLYFILSALAAFMPSGAYPYSFLEEVLMAVGEVAIIVGIGFALAGNGVWRILGILMSGLPVVYLVTVRIIFAALSGRGLLGSPEGAAIFAWVAMVGVGLYLELAGGFVLPFRSGGKGQDGSPMEGSGPQAASV